MSRPIVLSNGELHVGLNDFATVHDFYYPYVGFENHSAGSNLRHKIGVWVDGQISWIDNLKNPVDEWVFKFRYPHGALIGHTTAKNARLGIILEFDDFVDSNMSVFVRRIHIINACNRPREIRLFLHQAFAIGDSRSNTDTAQYLPDNNAILHYRGQRAFIVSGDHNGEPFDQHTVGLFGIEGREGTFKDAEDGQLEANDVEHGRVDSTLRFSMQIGAYESDRVDYWVAVGKSTREALYIHKQVINDTPHKRMENTAEYWREWLKPAYQVVNHIPHDHRLNFIESIMIIKSQIDKHGAVIASTDTSMLNYSRDAYSYCWPRDGAYVLWPLIRLGYKDEAYNFFQFMKRTMHSEGYMMHKYRADGALGSSWHSYIHDCVIAPPIQEDETAITLFMFAQYYQLHQDSDMLKEFYETMILPMADFMAGYINTTTGLPRPTYDLWEEVFMTSTYTTSVVYAALLAASDLASAAKDETNAVKWRLAANDIQEAAQKYLYNNERKAFYRGLNIKGGQIIYDDTIDCSSTFGAYIFGLFDANSDEVKNSVKTTEEVLGSKDKWIGLPRYEDDAYRRADKNAPINLWFITTLWLAQYNIDKGETNKALEILNWARDRATDTGIMAEQLNPVTNEAVSPAPLTWTHAEYVATLLDLIAKER